MNKTTTGGVEIETVVIRDGEGYELVIGGFGLMGRKNRRSMKVPVKAVVGSCGGHRLVSFCPLDPAGEVIPVVTDTLKVAGSIKFPRRFLDSVNPQDVIEIRRVGGEGEEQVK